MTESLSGIKRIPIKEKNEIDKALKTLDILKIWLIDQKILLKASIDIGEEEEDIEKQAEDFISNFEETFSKINSKL